MNKEINQRPLMFLEPDELRLLTGRAQKSKQIEQLRRMAIPFFVNAAGIPIVARRCVDGSPKETATQSNKPWRPSVLGP